MFFVFFGNVIFLVFSSICWDVEVIKHDTGMDTGKETNLSILEFLDQSFWNRIQENPRCGLGDLKCFYLNGASSSMAVDAVATI